MKWRVILAIARKDIVDAVKNLYILGGIVMPIVISLLLRLVFPSADESNAFTIAVHDPDGSRMVAELRALPQVELLEVASGDRLAKEVEENAVGGLAMPSGFDAAVEAGEQPELTVYLNQRRVGYERLAFRRLVEQQVWALAGREFPARIIWTNVAASAETRERDEINFNHYLLTMFLVMALSTTGAFVVPLLLVEEKEKQTLQVLLVSPATPTEVVVGKALAGLFYSLLTAGVLIGMNRGWAGDWPVTILVLLLGSLFLIAVGLLVGGLLRTTMQVNTWASIVMLALMSPSWFTIVSLPAPVDVALRLTPTYYLTQALGLALAGEASLARVGGHLAILLGSVIVAFAAVVWMLRREER
jgi:ABC-2 type transport system permease protein